MKALKDGATINPKFQPQNNKQAYLAYLCGLNIALPEPRTAEEVLLYKLCADGGKYLHTMTIRTYLGKITMTLKNNSAESLTGVYKENTDIFNGATLMLPAADIGQDEDFYATVIGYEGGDIGILMIDKDFPFPVIGSMPNVIDVMSGEVIDTVTTKDGGKLEQEKKVEITKNGATEIFPDEGYTLSRVVANVNVSASGENKFAQLVGGNITTEIVAQDFAGIEKIRRYAFNSCSIEKMTIPENIAEIEYYGISSTTIGCLTLPANIKLGQGAFASAKINKLYYNGDIGSWCTLSMTYADHSPISDITDFYVKNSAGEYEQVIEAVIPNGTTRIAGYRFARLKSLTKIVIPASVGTIGNSAFYECSNLTDVTIENGVQTIGEYAFCDCTSLTSIIIPDSVTSIGSSAFSRCSNLTQVTLPNNITTLKSNTLYNCTKIKFLTIPESVTTIEYNAIGIGRNVEGDKATITFLGTTPPTIHSTPFSINYIEKIIVPKGCGDAYKSATNWANFADYIEEAAE